jgi:hypothetical protein
MRPGIRLLLASSVLLSSTLAAPQGAEQSAQQRLAQQLGAEVFSAAQRMVDCLERNDLACIQAMFDLSRPAAGRAGAGLETDRREIEVTRLRVTEPDYFLSIDVAEPWPPIVLDGEIFVFVPTFSTYGVARLGIRATKAWYLIGISDALGESWHFIPVSAVPRPSPDAVDLLIPGYGNGPRPEVSRDYFEGSPFESSQRLQTTERERWLESVSQPPTSLPNPGQVP